jgi:PAS domain S-box-containing protein
MSTTVLSPQHLVLATAASIAGIAASLLTATPFGLLAPVAALFLYSRSRAAALLFGTLAIALAGSLLVVALYPGALHDLAISWSAFFAIAICIGTIVAISASTGVQAQQPAIGYEAHPDTPLYPLTGPTHEEKAAPRPSPIVSITAQDDKSTAGLMTAASFWGGTPFHLRYWRRQPDDICRWTEVRTEPQREPSGIKRWKGIAAEIDDQRPESERPSKTAWNPPEDDDAIRAAKVVERLLGNSWAFDRNGRPTYLTPIAQTFVSVTLEEFQAAADEGQAFFERTSHPDEYEHAAAAWRRSLETGDPLFLERRIRRASGIFDWSRTAIVPTRDSSGRVTGWYGASMDLDAYRSAELALRDRERELSQLVDMVPSHLWRLTADGEPVFFNKRMVDFLGMDVTDMDRPSMSRMEALAEALHPDDAVAFKDVLNRCLATGERFSMRYRLRRADGVYHWMSSRADPMRDRDGHIIQWYGLCHDIDDQVKAEEALRRSERQLQQMIDTIPVRIWSAAAAAGPVYFNKRYQDHFRSVIANFEDLTDPSIEKLLHELTHPEDAREVQRTLENCFRTGDGAAMRFRWREKDGVYRWAECRVEPRRNQDGVIEEWYGVSLDIDDEMRAQAALCDRERELTQLVNMVPVHISSLTPDGEPIFFNKRLLDFFGLNDVAQLDHPGMSRLATVIKTFIHPEDTNRLMETVRQSLATGDPYAMKYRMRGADDAYRWVEGRAEPLRDQSGAIVHWYAIAIDIDDQMRLYSDLEEREAKIRRLVDSDIIGIVIWDIDGTLIDANDTFLRMVQYDREDVKAGLRWFDMTPPDWQEVHAHEEAEELMRTGKMQVREKEYFRKDGSRVPVLIGGAFFEGQSRQGVAYILDLTERKRAEAAQMLAEEALRQTSDELAKATQAASLAELSASIAHEVNQPLAAIVANSHACHRWLSAEPPNLDRARLTSERIIRDANSAADVVSRIRALFRQSVKATSSTALSSAIADLRNLIAEEALRNRVRINVEVESDLPLVALDRVQVQQVLINLTRNGMQAMDSVADGRVLGIRVRREGHMVQTEISDCGPGVEFPNRIFEPFFTTKEHGMGMGLAICRSIVESHGGRLWVEENEPHGARFIFTLPIETNPVQ